MKPRNNIHFDFGGGEGKREYVLFMFILYLVLSQMKKKIYTKLDTLLYQKRK